MLYNQTLTVTSFLEMPPEYHHPANQAFLNRSQPPPQGFYPGPGSPFPGDMPPATAKQEGASYGGKLFRPWEEQQANDLQIGLSNLKIT